MSRKGRYANEFRQPYAAGAAWALHDYLEGFIGTAGDLLDSSGRPVVREQYVSSMKKGQKGKADAAYLRDYFLANIDRLNPKQRVPLADMIGPQGQALFKPEDLVFHEDVSTLWYADSTKVTSW